MQHRRCSDFRPLLYLVCEIAFRTALTSAWVDLDGPTHYVEVVGTAPSESTSPGTLVLDGLLIEGAITVLHKGMPALVAARNIRKAFDRIPVLHGIDLRSYIEVSELENQTPRDQIESFQETSDGMFAL